MKTTTSTGDAGRSYAGTVPSAILDLMPTRTGDTPMKMVLTAAPVSRYAKRQSVESHSGKNTKQHPGGDTSSPRSPAGPTPDRIPPVLSAIRTRCRPVRATQLRRLPLQSVPESIYGDLSVRRLTQHED